MSLDYIINVVMETIKPLDYAAVLASPIELHVATSSIRDLKPRIFTHFASKEELKIILKASTCLPIVAGSPVAYDNDLFLDGGVLLAHPVLTALEDGCTHVLAIRTRMDNTSKANLWSRQHLMANYLQHMQSGLGAAYLDTIKQYVKLRNYMQQVNKHQKGSPFILDVACANGAHQVTTFSQDRGVLFQGIRAGYSTMMEAIEGRSNQVYLRPTLFQCE